MSTSLRNRLARAGLNLTAYLAADDYEDIVPEPWSLAHVGRAVGSVLVVGNAGRDFWERLRASPDGLAEPDPVDRYVARACADACRDEGDEARGHAHYHEERAGHFLPLIALAERAGLGTPGRIGLLLHPHYGPWISLRTVIYLATPHDSAPPLDFAPCRGCPAPCASHCHGSAVGPETLDVSLCFRSKIRLEPCKEACAAREACVVGREHAFTREQIAHHSRLRFTPELRRRAREIGEIPPED